LLSLSKYCASKRTEKHEERAIAGNASVFATDFTYDLLNRTKLIQYPEDPINGKRITAQYSYCAYGVTGIDADGLILDKNIAEKISYNEFGQMTALTRGNGTNTTWDYDVRGRLLHIQTKRGSDTIQNISYTFRTDNSIESREDSTGENESARKVRYEYSYDGLNRLAEAKGSYLEGADGTKAKTYRHSYGYFANGNIKQKISAEKNETLTYRYENHAVTNVTAGTANRYTMRYDACGNMAEQTDMESGVTKRTEYDSQNRQIKARDGDKTVGEYAYDDQGFRVHKIAAEIIDGTETKVEVLYPSMYFAVEKQKTADGQDIPNTAYAANNVYLNGIRVAVLTSDKKAQYYLIDQVDSVNVVLDDEGKTIDRFEYEEFGTVWQTNGAGKNRPKYGSAEFDAETKLYYMNARYQNPELGRFTTADNVIDGEYDTQGWNRYSYCKNNPVRYKDPSGHNVAIPIAIIAAVVLTPKPTTNDMSDEEADKANEEYKEEVAMSIASALIPGGSNIKTIVNASRKAQKVHDKQTKGAGNVQKNKKIEGSAEEKVEVKKPYSPSNYPNPDPKMSEPPVRYEPKSITEVERMRRGDSPRLRKEAGNATIEAHHRQQKPVSEGGILDELERKTHRQEGNHTRHEQPTKLTPAERSSEIKSHYKERGKEYFLPGEGI
jgi:RHS repeat-associated protein